MKMETTTSSRPAKKYVIAGGDDACYGPRFGPMTATSVGRFGSGGSECLVLRLAHPIRSEQGEVEFIALRPRYKGVSFEAVQVAEATVGVWLLTTAEPESLQAGLSEGNSKYWAVGTCTPSEA